jgi:hypothetical protein
MNLRHAAALALVGWYLMTPPLNSGGIPDYDAPITSWNNEKSFDSARDCEEGKVTVLESKIEARKRLEQIQIHPDKQIADQYFRWTRSVFAASKCIATDDPRLKEK